MKNLIWGRYTVFITLDDGIVLTLTNDGQWQVDTRNCTDLEEIRKWRDFEGKFKRVVNA